ncbi:MAG: glycine--tRNA ligase [Acidimicrobiia bacterium]
MSRPTLDTIVNLATRRGILFPSSEIYGGLGSTWDYGPIGVELGNNIKRAWWRSMVQLRDDVVGLDSAVILHPKAWEASGHVESFVDPLVECTNCHQRWREDQIEGKCPNCGGDKFTDPRMFNLMFQTNVGPVAEEGSEVWLRPETCQGIFLDFLRVASVSRKKVPFGIAQIGKVFRNEITPGRSIFRTREFELMEMEYFVKPGNDAEVHQYWIDERMRWYDSLGMRMENVRAREHGSDEISHYSKRTVDLEYNFPWGWGELEGIANRGDWDLSRHSKFSGEDLSYFEQETQERYIPYVIEPSVGVGRCLFSFLIDAFNEEEAPTASGGTEKRTVLKLHHALAPFKAAVLPLSRHENLVPVAKEVANSLRPHLAIDYDDAASIGRRYRRHDEIGTPFAVTVDFDSLEDKAVTVRDRDTMQQERIPVETLVGYLTERLSW